MKYAKDEVERSVSRLHDELHPGEDVYTIIRHVSRSGMSRSIDVLIVRGGQLLNVTYDASRLLGDRIDQNHGGIVRGGCGMDMGFDLVYSMGRRLWPDGFECVGEGCPSNDHLNDDRDYTPGHRIHKDGGYALKQRWA